MLVKEFINVLKNLPQNYTIDYGMDIYQRKDNTTKYDIELFDLFNFCGTKNIDKNKTITLWIAS